MLRHTFCTHLADTGADTAVIRELAGHADIRTTTVDTAVSEGRLVDAVDERGPGSGFSGRYTFVYDQPVIAPMSL